MCLTLAVKKYVRQCICDMASELRLYAQVKYFSSLLEHCSERADNIYRWTD